MWDKIANKINDHVYMSSIDRDKQRIQSTAEIFTPTDLVIEMLSKIDINRLGIGKTVLDPACGDGQFLVAVKYIKVYIHQMSEEEARDWKPKVLVLGDGNKKIVDLRNGVEGAKIDNTLTV